MSKENPEGPNIDTQCSHNHGIWQPTDTYAAHRRQLAFYHRLKKYPDSLAGNILAVQEASMRHHWAHHIGQVLEGHNLVHNIDMSKHAWKNHIHQPTSSAGKATILFEAATLSKLLQLLAAVNV